MKDRVLLYLDDFAEGKGDNLAEEVASDLGIDRVTLQQRSLRVRTAVLHQYSQFSINTIDSFFQRVIRAFTREAGLLGNFRLEADNEVVMDEVIPALMDRLGTDADLTDWMVKYSQASLNKGDRWNITGMLKQFALSTLFSEQYKLLEDDVLKSTYQRHGEIRSNLEKIVNEYMDFMSARAHEALRIFQHHGITVDDLSFGAAGTPYGYFLSYAARKDVLTKVRFESMRHHAETWTNQKSLKKKFIADIGNREIIPLLNQMVARDSLIPKSAAAILKNYYSFGLLSAVSQQLQLYKEENNLMLLSDASKFLNGIIRDSDTPFLYEKVGTFFFHYLIDEFQDTSVLQWKNFIPLLREAADQGNANLIVGDVKQSIYRFRGGDLGILQHDVANHFRESESTWKQLNRNFRSARAIVDFNNLFFKSAASILNNRLCTEVYADVEQEATREGVGEVLVEIFDEPSESWHAASLVKLKNMFENLQDRGVKPEEIAILVRYNREGQEIAAYMLEQHQSNRDMKYSYEVISNEALRLDHARSVNILIAAMQSLRNPADSIIRAHLTYEYSSRTHLDELFVKARRGELEELLPEEFVRQQSNLKRLSMVELTEELIRIFQLGLFDKEFAYLQAFQDAVLEFAAREHTDLYSFLEWWEVQGKEKSIQGSGAIPAATISTIHKAKGLQFRYVIIPFCEWSMSKEKDRILWVGSDSKPFDEMGQFPIDVSDGLKDTVFANLIEEEKEKSQVDNLNLMYVAFTRAERGLYVFTRLTSEPADLKTTASVIYSVITTNPTLAAGLSGSTYRAGMATHAAGQADPTSATIGLAGYTSENWRKKLVIKREGAEFFEEESEKRSRINRGITVHQILSRITYRDDAEDALSQYFMEHALTDSDEKAIRKSVMSLVEHKSIGEWFSKDWQVKNEQLILMPGGGQKRIDRVMTGKKRTVIVDYKTGKAKPEDREQVQRYAVVLSSMGYANVSAYLLYLDKLEAVEVMRDTTGTLF